MNDSLLIFVPFVLFGITLLAIGFSFWISRGRAHKKPIHFHGNEYLWKVEEEDTLKGFGVYKLVKNGVFSEIFSITKDLISVSFPEEFVINHLKPVFLKENLDWTHKQVFNHKTIFLLFNSTEGFFVAEIFSRDDRVDTRIHQYNIGNAGKELRIAEECIIILPKEIPI